MAEGDLTVPNGSKSVHTGSYTGFDSWDHRRIAEARPSSLMHAGEQTFPLRDRFGWNSVPHTLQIAGSTFPRPHVPSVM